MCLSAKINNSKNGNDLSSTRTSNQYADLNPNANMVLKIQCRDSKERVKKDTTRNRRSYYVIYKCLCKYKCGLISKDEKSFLAKLEVDRDRELLYTISTQPFIQKANLTIKKEPLRSIHMDKYIMEFVVYK